MWKREGNIWGWRVGKGKGENGWVEGWIGKWGIWLGGGLDREMGSMVGWRVG